MHSIDGLPAMRKRLDRCNGAIQYKKCWRKYFGSTEVLMPNTQQRKMPRLTVPRNLRRAPPRSQRDSADAETMVQLTQLASHIQHSSNVTSSTATSRGKYPLYILFLECHSTALHRARCRLPA